MEKIPAACAMEWSIELDKGLRSRKPGKALEAVEQFGPRLLHWSMDPPGVPLQVLSMYGLVRGEDRAFANTILLRLADAFRTGDNQLRASIVKVFCAEWRNVMRKGHKYDGILVKQRVPNYPDMLKRVKMVYDSENIEARVLSLRLLGCWATFSKDNADTRGMVLSSLRSSHPSEVIASLFAAGNICRLTDFPCILSILADILNSELPSIVKLAAAQAFGKLQHSCFVIHKAYEVGKQLVLHAVQGKVAVQMVLSLTKLAVKSCVLVPQQIDFLWVLLNQECACCVKDVSWKCILFLLSESGYVSSVSWNVVKILLNKFNDVNFPGNLSWGLSSILQKILQSTFQSFSSNHISELLILVMELEVAVQSPNIVKSFLSIGLLLNIASNIELVTKDMPILCQTFAERSQLLKLDADKLDSVHFAHNVVILAIDKIGSWSQHVDNNKGAPCVDLFSQMKQECKMIFGLVLCVMKSYPRLYPIVLNRMRSLLHIHCLGKLQRQVLHYHDGTSHKGFDRQEIFSPCVYVKNGKSCHDIFLDMVLCIIRFVNASLCICYNSDVDNNEVYAIVRQIVECIKQSKCSDSAIFEASLHIRSVAIGCNNTKSGYRSKIQPSSGSLANIYWVQCEYIALQFAKEMTSRNQNWTLYRAGKRFACEGLWLAATFSFRKAVNLVQSESCSLWLKSLMLLAGAESELRSLLFPRLNIPLINLLHSDNYCGDFCTEIEAETEQDVDGNVNLLEVGRNIPGVYNKILSSMEMLDTSGMPNMIFYFQGWFISLRARILETVNIVLKLLASFNEGNFSSLVLHLAGTSFQLNKFAKEYDLLGSSFQDMDVVSSRSIATLALGCSLLAFSTASILFNPKTYTSDSLLSQDFPFFREHLNSLIQDLTERIWGIDGRCLVEIQELMPELAGYRDKLQSRSQSLLFSKKEKDTIALCRLAISSIFHFHEGTVIEHHEASIRVNKKALEIMFEILKKWLELPFRLPKYFFRTRPCLYMELFVFQANSSSANEIKVSVGEQLSLNICIQMRNASEGICPRILKIYSILGVSSSDRCSEKEKGKHLVYNSLLNNSILVDMHEKLLQFMKNGTEEHSRRQIDADFHNGQVHCCVCIEPNMAGQGFTSCLLDVSAFAHGTYHITFHSCCEDNNGSIWSLPSFCTAQVTIHRSSNTI